MEDLVIVTIVDHEGVVFASWSRSRRRGLIVCGVGPLVTPGVLVVLTAFDSVGGIVDTSLTHRNGLYPEITRLRSVRRSWRWLLTTVPVRRLLSLTWNHSTRRRSV